MFTFCCPSFFQTKQKLNSIPGGLSYPAFISVHFENPGCTLLFVNIEKLNVRFDCQPQSVHCCRSRNPDQILHLLTMSHMYWNYFVFTFLKIYFITLYIQSIVKLTTHQEVSSTFHLQ